MMNSPNLLTRSGNLLFQLSVLPTRNLKLLRIILSCSDNFIGTWITSTVLTRGTLCDWHFAVAEKNYWTVVGLAHMLQWRRRRQATVYCHGGAAEGLLLLLLRIDTYAHVMTTRITIILHINLIMRTINITLLILRWIFDWITATVWPIFAATRCATTVSNENINFTCNGSKLMFSGFLCVKAKCIWRVEFAWTMNIHSYKRFIKIILCQLC